MSTIQALQMVSASTFPSPITRDDLTQMGKPAALRIATEALHCSIKTLFMPEHVVELRALEVTTPEKRMPHIDSGYYDGDHRGQLVERALWLQRHAQAKGVYVTLQEIRPALLARRANRSAPAKETTADHDVARYRWLPVDLDMHPSVRPSGISSSPEQWTQIHHTAALLREALLEMGWPQPIYADSGNGAHLLWRIDLAPSAASLLSRVLGAIHARAKQMDQDVEVDLKNYNPARIWKLYGTLACKGDHMSFAPHRLSRILEASEQSVVLTVEQMEDICAQWGQTQTVAPKPRKSAIQHNPQSTASTTSAPSTLPTQSQQSPSVPAPGSWTVEGWAPKVGLDLPEAQVFHSQTGPGQKWNLKPCPCARKCPDGAAIQQAGDGVVSFRCHHNTCEIRSWDDLRTFLGDPKHTQKSPPSAQPTAIAIPLEIPKPPLVIPDTAPPESVEGEQHPHQPASPWQTALDTWVEIFKQQGPRSEATLSAFGTLLQPLVLEWELLPLSMKRPETILAKLPKSAPEHLMVWTRRVERLLSLASLRVRQPKLLRSDDDRAATFLRAAATADTQVSAELEALDEPWRVAFGWVMRSAKETRNERVEIFLQILRQTSQWFNRSTADQICRLTIDAGIDRSTILETLPESIHPPQRALAPQRTKQKPKSKDDGRDSSKDCVRVLDVLPGAPVRPDLIIPEPYVIYRQSIGQMITKYHDNGQIEEIFEEHLPRPLLITTCQRDQEGIEWLTLAWSRLNIWRTLVVERSMICDRAKIVSALSSHGAPVDSTNVSFVIKWLMTFEKANLHFLPIMQVSTRMGWQNNDGFLLGDLWIDSEGEHIVDASDPFRSPKSWAFAHMCGTDRADVKAFDACEGSLDAWMQVVAQIVSLPRVLVALYASLAAPLVSLLGGRTPIIDWSGPAGTGKTSTLRLAASVWGNPSEFNGRIIGGWNTTAVAIERRAGLLGHLPMILNDSNKALDGLPGKVIYELAEGTGKQRGDRSGGRQFVSSWSTVILSTGESCLLDFAKASDAGTAHRVLSLHGHPWGSTPKADLVRRFREGLEVNYGHAGRLFVRWLAAHQEKSLATWKDRRRTLRESFDALTSSNAAAERISEDLALILVAAELAHEALSLPWSIDLAHTMAHQLFSDVLASTNQCAAHEKALHGLWEWCWSHRDAFWGRRRMESPPPLGWAGRWDNHEQWEEIFILPSVADRVLSDLGYQPASIRKEWADVNFIRRGEGRNLLAAVRIDGIKLRCLALKHESIMNVCSINNDSQIHE